jgi:transposase-like protein
MKSKFQEMREMVQCPKCGSFNVWQDILYENRYVCNICGTEFVVTYEISYSSTTEKGKLELLD